MANTTYYDLYKALKADGAVQGDWNSFHSFVGAQGKKGYENRKKLYDALKADGAVQAKTYEEFNMNLFRGGQASLRAAKQRRQQQAQRNAQPSARNTAAQRALQMSAGGTDYMRNWQLLHKRDDQMTPTERIQASNMRGRMQEAQEKAYKKEAANPINNSAAVPNSRGFYETMHDLNTPEARRARAIQQRKDDATVMAAYEVTGNKFTHNNGSFSNVAASIDPMVAPAMKEADDLSWSQYQEQLKAAGGDAYLRDKAWKDLQDNRIKNRQEVLAKNLSAKLTDIYSERGMQEHIIQSADKLNMGVEEYVDKYVTPQIMNRAQEVLNVKNIEEVMPKSSMEYVVKRLSDSILGTLSAGQDKSKDQRLREQQAMAIADDLEEMPRVTGYNDKKEYYRSGMGTRFVSTTANMAMDSPILGMTGGGANVSVDLGKQVLMRGLAKVGLVKAGAKLTAEQLGFKIANMTMAQKIGSGLLEGTAKGALNLGGYSAITGALGQASTGDDTSLSALAQAGWEGFKHGATTGAMFRASGAVMAPWVQKYGINGMETTRGERWLHGAQKVGATAVGLGVEAGTMMVADNITGDKEISVGQWLEDVVMVGAFKAGEPKNYGRIGQALYGLTHNTSSTFRFGKDSDGNWRSVDIRLTDAEKGELINSTSGKNLMDAFASIDKARKISPMNKTAYTDFMKDPDVSQSTKEKVNAAMGLFNTTRKRSYRSVNDVKNKQILEYAQDGTLLTRTSYKNAEERRAVLYRQNVYRDNEELLSLVGYTMSKDREYLDKNGMITKDALDFLMYKGYDLSKNETDPKNAKLIADMKDESSELHKLWVENRELSGALSSKESKEAIEILKKDPMKRTNEEAEKLRDFKTQLETQLFPDGVPHPDQSQSQGRAIAEEEGLGTEKPNPVPVVSELRTLKQVEEEMAQLMNSNDVFSENFNDLQKKGLTHPQIYDWMIQNGLTEDDLLPYAKYMNQVDRVQGMQDATAKAIEENVGAFVQDWTFHGTMDGQEVNGENALWVKDKDGRTLLVGSGDVAYDPTTGRAKEGVGDMLVCLDHNTGEMVYVRAEDTTLFDNKPASDLEAFRRQQLQEINSAPYNQAAQEQAAADAAKPQQEGAAEPENKVGQPQQENTHSEAFKKIVDLAKKQKEYWDNPDGVEKVDVDHEINELLKTLSDEEFEEISDVLVNIDEDLEYHTYNEHERREEANWAKGAKIYRESLQQVKEQLAPYSGALKAAVESSNKTAIAKAQKELTDALLASNLGHGDIYVHLAQFKLAKKKDESYREKRALIKPLTDAINAIESALDSALADAGLDGVHVDFKDNGRGWIYADKGSAWSRRLEPLDNNYRNVSQYDGVNHATTLPQITMDNVAKVAGIIKSRIEEGERYNSDKYRDSEDANNSSNSNETEGALTFKDGSAVPVDANGEPDFMNMTPEQCAEVYKTLFPKTYEAEVDSAIKMLDKDLKGVQKATPKSKGVMARAKEQADIEAAITLAEEQLAKAQAIKKALTAEKVAETMAKPEGEKPTEEANQAGSAAAEKFQNAPRLVGNKRTRTLPNNEKVKGHYEIVPAESLTPSHDAMNGYKKSDGFPVDSEGRTINDRDYENDKSAQQNTDQIALKYNGQAIEQVPVVSDEGIVYDGNGRTMAGQKAAKDGTDAEYINDLMDNAENFGFTREQIEQSGIEHPRLVMVTDERMPYTTDTFAKFNRNEKKTQSNTEQAVAKAKTLSADEVGAIVAEIEGNGSLEAFFNNPNAINSLIKTLVSKDIIGQNEVAELMEGNDRLSPQGKEMVKNILLGSIFKPETIRMLGVDSAIKNKAVAAIRSVMDNLKLGDYSLRDEIDSAIQLLYEARRGDNKVDTLLRTPEFFGESAADRYPSISQMMALALEGKVSDFRDLINEYNREAAARNTGEGDMFGDTPTKEELIRDFLEYKKWKDYETRGNSETERSNDAEGVRKTEPEAQGGNGEKQAESRREVDEADYIDGKDETSAPITITTKSGNEHSFDAEQVDLAKKIIAENPENPVPKLQRKLVIGYNVAEELAKALGWQNPEDKISRTEELIRKTLYPTISDFKENPEKARKDLATLFNTLNNEELKVVAKDALISSFQIDKNGTAKDDWHSVAIEEVKSLLKARGVLIKKGSRGLAEGDTAIDKYGYIHKVIAIKGETIVIEYDNGEQEETKKREVKYYFHSQEQAAERNNGNQSGFEQFMEDSPETENIKTSDRSAMQKFSDKALSLQSAETKDYSSYNAQKTTVEIKADNLFKSEKDWFSLKKYGDSIAFHDKKNGCSYELSAYKDARGHLKSVFVTKYHDFKDGADSKPRLQKVDLEDLPKEYRDFSSELGVDALNLFLYGESMKYNDSAYAYRYLRDLKAMYLREHVAEKKAIMERDGVSGLIANRRLFEPIEKAIKEKYGDVDALIEERRKRAEEERNVMEAARKRVEEEERKRQERLEKLSLISDEDLDKRYMDALAKGDEATAREMLDEVARRKGYGDADSDYQGVGAWSAPSNPGYESDEARRNAVGDDSPDLNIEDMAAGYNNQPNDIFEHPEKYSQGLSTSAESGKAIQAAVDAIKNGDKDVKVKVYRAVPTSVKEGKLRNGDWVTPSRRYAEIHGNNRLDGKYRIIEDEVPAKELWWDSNDVNEWGYDNGKSYKYKNAKNNRKSNDLVTRDDKGEVIPPSKRFNSRKADERYQKAEDAKKASKREQALRDAVVDTLRDAGIEVSMDAEEGQRVLDESNGKARMQAKMSALIKAANSIRNWLTGNKRNKVFTIELPQATQRMVRNVMGRDFDSHNITANGIAHAKKNHGVNGTKLTENSIPLRDADFELIPYIMTAPSYVRKGTSDKTDRESIRFYKELGNGYVVVAEKEYKNSPNDMETITMWAELSSSEATNARRNAPDTHVQNAILSTEDAAKIRKDAETAIENDVNLREQRVFHGAGADITDHVRFFRTSNGEAYGYTIGGKIYIDPRIANSETPVHEYAHLWATALRSGNAEEWQNVVGLMKGTSVWDEVKKRYPELKTNDEVADEVLAAYSGRRGAERLREEMDNAKGDAKSALQRVKEAIGRFWKATADMLHIHYKSAEEVADRVMKDLLDGVNPRKMGNASAYPMEALTKAAEEYRNERSKDGVQYSKTDAKDVKNSRIIPEDVDKSVSSQIEKKFDNTINDISSSAGKEYRNNIQSEVDYVTSLYSNMRRVNVEHEKTYYENEIAKLSRGTRRGGADSANGSSQSKQSDSLSDARTNLAAIERELAYRDARAKTIRDTYGLSRGSKITPDVLERIFKEGNPGKEQTELFQKAFNIAKRLGVDITMESGADTTASGEATISRKINLFLDGLVRTRSPKGSMSRVLLHEMLHQSTMGAINLVKSGKAKGMLTDKQIEAVNTILDLYDKVKNDKERFKEEPYGLQNEYEFAAQMADLRQRKALDLDVWDRIKNAAHELANKGDRSMWQTFKDAVKKLFEVSDKDVMDKALNDIMDDFNETVDDISMNDIEQDGFAYKVTDKDELDRLNKEKTFRMYSGMQELDGKLYSPMAAIIDGKRTDATEIGAWMRSDERPDLVKGGKFTLVKTDKSKGAGEGDVDAAYNPYMHTSTSMMNDQFTGAYARGNIKVVEWDIPESEKTSGYHAEGAKNSVGLVPWHSGSVNGLLPKDRQRSVMLSRWRKAVRVVPDSEVAESIANQLKGTGLAIPWNVVTPNQLRELAKLGVPITTKESGTQSPDVKAKFNAQMEDLKKEFPQAKFVDVKMTKDAHKEWGKNGGTHFRMELGKTFSNSKEDFDGVRGRAVEENGIVMPNLNKESVNVVPVENHNFGNDIKESIENANKWAKENLVTSGNDLPTMRDGTPYTISKAAIDKYLSKSATSKSEDLNTHLSVLQKLTDVIHESIEAEIHPDYKKGDDGVRNARNGYGDNILIHRLYGAVELDGKMYRVKTTMQEFRGGEENKPHSYEVTKIELLEGSEKANESDSLPLSSASNNSIEAAKLLNGVEKSYDSGKKLLDESKDLTEGDTYFKDINTNSSIADDAPLVVKHVDKIAKQVGGKVKMAASPEEVTNKEARERIERGENVTGWYDEKTGEVHLYMPNIHDRYTAEKTIWHEVVGHKGMRELIGEENYSNFLRSLWYDLDRPENARLKELVSEELKYNPLDFENGIEEGIARLVEDGKGEPGFWNNIKNKVTDMLHEIGYRVAPNTKDVKYLLWLAKNMQKHPNDLTWKMRADAVRYKLSKENVPAIIGKDGVFYGNDGKGHSFDELTKKDFEAATDGQIHFRTTPSAATALDRYHKSLDKHGYMFTESYMDNMLSLKNLMQAIEPNIKNIADIKSSENPYILQNTMQGAMSNAAQMFERNVMKPLDKAMAGVLDAFEGKNDEAKIKNFNLYMITKHGLERNRVLFVRDYITGLEKDDADILRKQWNAEKKDLDDRLRNGTIDLKDYYEEMDEWIRNNVDDSFVAGDHDYSGIHAIQEVEKDSDPYDDNEAIASVMDAEANMESLKKGSTKDFWDKVKAATQYALDCDYKNGLMDKELYGHVSDMFNWYVPLRKYDEKTAEDTYGYITEKGDPKNFIGKTIMRAKGRKSLSETNVLAQIGAMGNRAINNGGQNAIKQAFARFIRSHSDNNLVTETSVWYVDDPKTQTTTERYPEIPDDATPDEINQIVSDFNAEMMDLESKGLATKKRRRGSIGYRFQKAENKSQHLVDVMIAGKKHTFVVNGNPRAAQALNGLLENSSAKGIMKPLGSISRMMAQLCTSFNPEFVMRNIMRDAEFASSNVTAKEGARYGGIWAKYYAQLGLYKGASNISLKDLSGSTGLGLFAKYRNGTLDMNDKVQRYFKEFMENGGETGWVQIKNMKEWEKQYKEDVKGERSKVRKNGKMLHDFFFGNLENLNEVAENIARFSTYCASRDYGRSIVRSTYDAKEVSTNFNRHGSGDAIKSFKNGEMGTGKAVARWGYGFTSSYLRHCSMFFNAGIQSTNLLVNNLKTNPVGTSVNMLAIPFALGALAALGNNALIASEDEKDRKGVKDPYGEMPDYIRRNNLCIYKGGGEFVTIPLAIELRAFYGLGDLAAGLTFSPNVSGQKNPFFDAVGSISQLVPVMDYLGNSSAGKDPIGETIKAITPSAISPFVEWEMNSDWKGSPIERRGDYNKNVPAWQRANNGTPEILKTINKFVNAATNDVAKGNEDMLGNGFLDMVTNPSMLNHYFGGIGGGAATFSERLLGVIKHGKDTETNDIPFVRSLLYTPSEQTSLQRTKSKWYNYKDELETTMANVSRLKSKNVPIDKRLTNIADYYNFQNSSDAAKVRIIDLAEKQMNRWKKMRDRASDTESVNFANQNIDRIMMEAVEELDRME